jgi:lipopolysaccharide kinase (Kdo/WaaP) family protein
MIVRWRQGGWSGWLDLSAGVEPAACLAAAAAGGGRRSRHAWTTPLPVGAARFWLKVYPAPDGRRARRAARLGAALRGAGFVAPETVLLGRRGGAGLLVMRDVGGTPLVDAVAGAAGDAGRRRATRRLLRALGQAVGRLHAAGFVPGDLVPSNVHVVPDGFAFLDHDRTRRSRLLVRIGGRRNLVQLGRFVVPGVGMTDRARVLAGYAGAGRLGRRARHRLAGWVTAKTIERRCAIDDVPRALAAEAGFPALMRSGGPFDPARGRGGGRAAGSGA